MKKNIKRNPIMKLMAFLIKKYGKNHNKAKPA